MISEGDQVVLKKENNVKVFRVCRKRDVYMDKVKFTLDSAIGCPYGTMFEVKNGKLFKLEKGNLADDEGDKKAGVDNRDLHDLDTNQKLSHNEIEQMKRSGESREKLIERLVEHSVTFEKKTEFAQAKYIKKKKLKHLMEFRIMKTNARHLCEMYFSKAPAKICNMRSDSLAQILTYGNVRSGIKVGVVDSCQGLVVGAVMERLGGCGKVVNFHPGATPVRPIFDMFGFQPEFTQSLYNFPMNQINPLRSRINSLQGVDVSAQQISPEGTAEQADVISNSEDVSIDTAEAEEGVEEDDKETAEMMSGDVGDEEKGQKRPKGEYRKKRQVREQQQIEDTRKFLLENKLDCLIVATKFHPTPIVVALLEFLAPSRPLVVYCQHKEPLMDCYSHIREKGGLINFHLTETWLRQYQVLPMRTHPVIQMCGASGYLLVCGSIKT